MVPLIVIVLVIGVPIAELYVFVQMSHAIGFFNSLFLLAAVSIVGAWIVKRQGLRVWRRFNEQLARGAEPTREIADGVALLVAGALLLAPGFITDAIGVLLLLPPVRAVLRTVLARRSPGKRSRIVTATYSGPITNHGPVDHRGAIDVGSEERD